MYLNRQDITLLGVGDRLNRPLEVNENFGKSGGKFIQENQLNSTVAKSSKEEFISYFSSPSIGECLS